MGLRIEPAPGMPGALAANGNRRHRPHRADHLLQPFMSIVLAFPVNGEAIDVETVLFAAAVVAVVLIGQRMRVARR
jgi:hypothetical protein